MLELTRVISQFKKVAAPEAKAWREAYMRHQFVFYGVTKAQIDVIAEPIIEQIKAAPSHEALIKWVNALWNLPERENQYLAMHLLLKFHSLLTSDDAEWIVNELVIQRSWWDTIDTLRNVLALILDRETLTYKSALLYAKSANLWVRRTSLLLGPVSNQVSLNQQVKIIERTKNDNNFFIQKAIGWSLRDYAKRDMSAVVAVVATLNLSKLAAREALKHYQATN